MVNFLARIFIKNYKQTELPKVRQAYGVLCGGLGIALNLLMFAGKFLAGILSNSIAITADAFNNLSDSGSSLITLFGFRLAGQEADQDHPFGHGRIEYLTGLLVSMLILLMGFELFKTSVEKIRYPEETVLNGVILFILIASVLIKFYMFLYNRSIGRLIGSAAMQATATDCLSDMISTSVVLLSNIFGHFTGFHIDGWCGLLVGLLILYAGFNAAKDTINPLLGQPPQKELVNRIEELVLESTDIIGIHDLIVHDYGPGRVMISLHAEVSANGDLLKLHDTIDNIERKLNQELHCQAVIHMDPVLNDDEETRQLKEAVLKQLREIDPVLNLHDFRIVKGPTHTNLIFDILMPYSLNIKDSHLVAVMQEKIRDLDKSYYAVINVDKDYTVS